MKESVQFAPFFFFHQDLKINNEVFLDGVTFKNLNVLYNTEGGGNWRSHFKVHKNLPSLAKKFSCSLGKLCQFITYLRVFQHIRGCWNFLDTLICTVVFLFEKNMSLLLKQYSHIIFDENLL